MARLWQCGFELTSLTEVSASSGTAPTLASGGGIPRTGTYALRTSATTNTSFVRYHPYTTDQNISGHQGISFLIETALPTVSTTILRFSNAANDPMAQVRLTTGGKLQLWNSSGTQVGSDSTATLTTGVYYDLELKCDATGNPGSIALWLDNVSVASGANDVQGSWSRILCGIIGTNSTASILWDDWKLNNDSGSVQTGRTSNGKILHIRPNGDGDNHGWSNTSNAAGSSTNYTLVDEVSPNSATDYVQTGVATTKDYYTLDDTGIGSSDTINVVMVGMQMRNNTADATTAVKLGIKKTSGGTITQGSAVIPNSTSFTLNQPVEPRNYSLITYLDPDGAAWTQATLDTAQAGVELTTAGTNRIQVSNVWVSIDYTPSSTTPISNGDTGAGADTGSVSATTSSAETGAGADSESVSAATSNAETGTGVDATAITAQISASDTGAGVDTESVEITVAVSSSDTGSGADAGAVTASTQDSDTGAGADSGVVTAQISSADTATGVDAQSVFEGADVSSGDTGSGADTEALTAATSSGDTGAGTDAETVAAALSNADTGAGADAGSVSAALSAGDTASGADAQSVAVTVSSDDPGTGVDSASPTILTGDTAGAVDAATVSVTVTSGDAGAGAEESLIGISSSDTASGVDTQSVDQDTIFVSSGDTASGVDTESVTASISSGDLGSSADDTTDRTLDATELGSSADTEAVQAALTSADTASAVQTEAVEVGPTSSDAASGTDVAEVSAILSATDAAAGVDAESVMQGDQIDIFDGDTAAAADAQGPLGVSNDDSAVAVDGNAVFAALLVGDAFVGAEGSPAVGVNSSDTATVSDDATPFVILTVIDSVSALDANQALHAEITESEGVTGTDALAALNVSTFSGDTGAGAEASPSSSTLGSGDAASGNELSAITAALVNADTATAAAQVAMIAGYAVVTDQAIVVENDSVLVDNLFDQASEDQAFALDEADIVLDVSDGAFAQDFARLILGVPDGASALDFASVILGVFSSDTASATEAAAFSVVRMSDDPIVTSDAALVSVSTSSSEIVHARDSASVFITPTRSHKVMPYYIREPQNWAIEQERRRHNEALWYVGENTMFVLMWHLEDFLDNLVGRCPTCYESQGRIASVYGQSDEYKCPDCFGTTFEGGFKALIVRPAIFSDSDESESKVARGVVHPQDLTIESTPDFRIRTGDYCFRVNGDRYYMRVPERITLRTGFGHATQTDTAIGYNHANAAVEDPDSVAYMIPPSNDEVSQILNRSSRIPRDWGTFEVIRAPLIPSSDLIGGP